MSMYRPLIGTEDTNLALFIEEPQVKELLSCGGSLALVYSSNSGIGVSVTAHVRDAAYTTFLQRDITDYGCW